jgi:uncharacterized RDD family membrane protein YckC
MNFKSRNERFLGTEVLLAPIKKRFAAFLIDWMVLVTMYLFIISILNLFNISISKVDVISIFDVEIEMNNVNPSTITIFKILFGLLPVLYFSVLFYCFNGQTIGKFFLRLRVVSLYHEDLGLWHCIERSLGYFVSALEFGFGFIQAFWNPNRMSLHDKIGETIVVYLPRKKAV